MSSERKIKLFVKALVEAYGQKSFFNTSSLSIFETRFTGHGCYILFCDPKITSLEKPTIIEISRNSFGTVSEVPNGVGFILTVEGKEILMLEVFSQGSDPFPNYFPEISNIAVDER